MSSPDIRIGRQVSTSALGYKHCTTCIESGSTRKLATVCSQAQGYMSDANSDGEDLGQNVQWAHKKTNAGRMYRSGASGLAHARGLMSADDPLDSVRPRSAHASPVAGVRLSLVYTDSARAVIRPQRRLAGLNLLQILALLSRYRSCLQILQKLGSIKVLPTKLKIVDLSIFIAHPGPTRTLRCHASTEYLAISLICCKHQEDLVQDNFCCLPESPPVHHADKTGPPPQLQTCRPLAVLLVQRMQFACKFLMHQWRQVDRTF